MTLSRGFSKTAAVLGMLAAVAIGSSLTAKADSITVFGNANSNLQATINIISLTNGSITFSVTNVLVAGVSSTITGVGFQLPGTITANSPGACEPALACGNFGLAPTVSNSPGNVPQFPGAVLDWAVITGPNFPGGNPSGIDEGVTAMFTVTGNFTGLNAADFLAGVFARFQDVNDPNNPETSDVAHDPIPEPATMILLGTGLLGVAGALRRRFRK